MGLGLVARERQRGIEIGIAQGTRLALLNQFAVKFGPLDPRVEQRVMAGSDDEVDGWVAGILTAPTVEALLGPDAAAPVTTTG